VNALAPEGDEGRGKLRKASGSRKQALIEDIRMGNPARMNSRYSPLNKIGGYELTQGSEPSQYLGGK